MQQAVGVDEGHSMLLELSNAMVRAQKDCFGKGPSKAKAYLLDDMLMIALRGGLTRAEESMLEFGRPDEVRQFRQVFQNEMTGRLVGEVERITGRKVLTYQSQVLFDPNMSIELFVFESDGGAPAVRAVAEAVLEDG